MATLLSHVARGVVRALLAIGLACSIFVLAALAIGPRTGRYRMQTILSGSMGPKLPVGSLAISTPERLDRVRACQIITFQAPVGNWVVTHRVIEVVSGGPHPRVRTKGDANAAIDPWVTQLERGPVWRVRLVVPRLGSAVRALRMRWVHIGTVLVAPMLLVLLALRTIWAPDLSWRHVRRARRPPRATS